MENTVGMQDMDFLADTDNCMLHMADTDNSFMFLKKFMGGGTCDSSRPVGWGCVG